jgi:hypothetical protein
VHPSRLAELVIGPATSGRTRWLAPQDDGGMLGASIEARAPPTAQERGPPSPLSRGGMKPAYAARTREKKVATLVSRSLAREDSSAVHWPISPTAVALLPTVRSTEAISVEACAVWLAAV